MKKILCLFLFVAISARAYIPPAPQTLYYTTTITNFFSLPGDSVSISAGGRNMATNGSPVVFDLYFDTNDLFTTGEMAGNGMSWSLNSRLDWDGTNINWFAQFTTGDPSNSFVAIFGTLTNAIIGTNQITYALNENTNGLTLDSSTIVASRAPQSTAVVTPNGQSIQANGIVNYISTPTNSIFNVTVDASNRLVSPTNFFNANSNANWVVISPFVAGYVAAQNFATNNGTNFVTVQLFTNAMLSSQQILTYQTNNAFWGISNYLARVHGLYSFALGEGDDAGNPPMQIIGGLIGSYDNTNWFAVTNGFWTTNDISIAQTNTGVSYRGSTLVNPGYARLYSVDHLELIGRTNSLFAQHLRFDSPTDPNDAATKAYVDGAVANTLSPFLMTIDTNGVTHVSYSHNGQVIMDMTSAGGWMHIDSFAPDASGTNGLLSIAATNFIAGWQIQSSTNLTLVNGWSQFTNWTAVTTNAGEVTFTIPLLLPQQFFRGQVPATNNVVFNAPVAIKGQQLTGSGVLQFWVTTNTPTIGDLGNQMGARYWVSNGFCWITGSTNGTTLYSKILAP